MAASAPPLAARRAWLGFLVVLAAAVMDLLDSTIAQTAAPAIRRELGGSYAALEWISAAYTLAMSVTLLLGSRLGDLFGRRQVLLAGIAGFICASTLCAIAPSSGTLIAARALQGAVAAIMVPQGFGLIRELFGDARPAEGVWRVRTRDGHGRDRRPARRRRPDQAQPARPRLAGDLPRQRPDRPRRDRRPAGASCRAWPPATPDARLDGTSVGLAMLGGVALVYPLIQGREHGWPAWSFAMLAVGVVTLGGLRRAPGPPRRATAVRRWSSPRSCAGARTWPGWPWWSDSSARWAA